MADDFNYDKRTYENYVKWLDKNRIEDSKDAYEEWASHFLDAWWEGEEHLGWEPEIGVYCKTCARVDKINLHFGYPKIESDYCQAYTEKGTHHYGKPRAVISGQQRCPYYIRKEWYKSCQG